MPGDVLISRVPHNQPVLELAEGILALREAVTAAESCGPILNPPPSSLPIPSLSATYNKCMYF